MFRTHKCAVGLIDIWETASPRTHKPKIVNESLNILGPRPLGPLGGAKWSNIIKSQLQSQFQRYAKQTLYVFSQMKDIKHVRWDFHSIPCVMPQGLGLGGAGRSKLF